jgi:hypothetical protein
MFGAVGAVETTVGCHVGPGFCVSLGYHETRRDVNRELLEYDVRTGRDRFP